MNGDKMEAVWNKYLEFECNVGDLTSMMKVGFLNYSEPIKNACFRESFFISYENEKLPIFGPNFYIENEKELVKLYPLDNFWAISVFWNIFGKSEIFSVKKMF